MQSAFDNIRSSLAPIASAPATSGPPAMPAAGGGGKFSFAPDEVEAIAKEWLDLADEYTPSLTDTEQIVFCRAPGAEYASESHAARVTESGRLYAESLVQKQEYCYSQAQKFQDALHDYLGIDRVNVRTITSAGENPSKPGGI